jgi:hypothetical protein
VEEAEDDDEHEDLEEGGEHVRTRSGKQDECLGVNAINQSRTYVKKLM